MPPPPPRIRTSSTRLLTAATLTLLAAFLYRFPPTRFAVYPQCPIWTLLHLQCPGCGTTRALAALLHGHVTEALHRNALTTCALPLFLLWTTLRRTPAPTLPHPAVAAVGLAIAAVFTLVRNL